MKKFFRAVEHHVSKALKDTRDPLILATVDTNFALYKEINTYPLLFEDHIPGHPDNLDNKVLLEKGFPLIRPFFKKERTEAEERYHHFNGTGKTSSQLEEIALAAKNGQIDTLFVAREVECWGTIDENIEKVTQHDHFEAGDEDLLSYASIQTLINKGTVFSVKPEFMPDKTSAAAIFRY